MLNYNNCDHIYSFGEEQNLGCLWLGDYNSAKSKKTHREKNIKTVVTAGLGMKVALSEPIKHKMFPLYDSPIQNIERFFQQAFEHIEQGLKNGNVLVHCYAGVSRSSTIVISYLMKKLDWSFKQALQHVRKKRWVVNPNPGFVKQLKRYQGRLKMGSSQIINPQNNSFIKTVKNQQKAVNGLKTYSSVYSNKISGERGRSLFSTKPQIRAYNAISLIKK